MIIKKGAKIGGIRPEMIIALMVAERVYDAHGEELVWTEGTGGEHGYGSLHYVGLAIDIRTRYFSKTEAAQVALEIRERLGEDFDVVLEEDHIHIEFQPK